MTSPCATVVKGGPPGDFGDKYGNIIRRCAVTQRRVLTLTRLNAGEINGGDFHLTVALAPHDSYPSCCISSRRTKLPPDAATAPVPRSDFG